ncbi:hypothetical protein GASC598B02_009180 [Gilliamella apicola SCGC AB-598-B02]|nr:hypothetical protein GASC598B02_009180 [Gilliamella apicola SCGC AB-598-B02]
MIVVTFEVIGGMIGSLTSGNYFKRKDFFHFISVYFLE